MQPVAQAPELSAGAGFYGERVGGGGGALDFILWKMYINSCQVANKHVKLSTIPNASSPLIVIIVSCSISSSSVGHSRTNRMFVFIELQWTTL